MEPQGHLSRLTEQLAAEGCRYWFRTDKSMGLHFVDHHLVVFRDHNVNSQGPIRSEMDDLSLQSELHDGSEGYKPVLYKG